MCEFKYCQGKQHCFLADTSPCPEFQCSQRYQLKAANSRRVVSRRGFVETEVGSVSRTVVGRRNKQISRVA
jgi:hypothetical protein